MKSLIKRVGAIAAALVAALVMIVPAPAFAASVQRLAGSDRLGTMSQIVSAGWANGSSQTVVLASAENWPDALSASPLAGTLHCPVVTTSASHLSGEAAAQIARVGATKAYVLGGTAAISDSVLNSLRAIGVEPVRLAGAERVATGIEAYKQAKAAGASSSTCILSASTSYADALAISPYAYASGSPIFLANADGSLSASVIDAMKNGGFKSVIVLGGTGFAGSIKDSVARQAAAAIGGTWPRIAGADRVETSKLISYWETGLATGSSVQPNVSLTWDKPAVAYAWNFPDALASVSVCGVGKSPVLLVDNSIATTISATIGTFAHDASALYVLGGTAVVSDGVAVTVASAQASAPEAPSPYSGKLDVNLHEIMGSSGASVASMVSRYNAMMAELGKSYPADVYTNKGAADITAFCTILVQEAQAEGVREDVLYAQVMHETGWLQFGGDVKADQCNFGGIGATGGGAAGATFPDVRTGLRAQVQHLKAYASKDALNNLVVDPRFDKVTRGSAPYVEWLGKADNPNGVGWAWPGNGYGSALVSIMDTI